MHHHLPIKTEELLTPTRSKLPQRKKRELTKFLSLKRPELRPWKGNFKFCQMNGIKNLTTCLKTTQPCIASTSQPKGHSSSSHQTLKPPLPPNSPCKCFQVSPLKLPCSKKSVTKSNLENGKAVVLEGAICMKKNLCQR